MIQVWIFLSVISTVCCFKSMNASLLTHQIPLHKSVDQNGGNRAYLEQPVNKSISQHIKVQLESSPQKDMVKYGGKEVSPETPLEKIVDEYGGDDVYLETPLQESVVKEDGDDVYLETPLQESVVKEDGDDVYLETPLQESVVKEDGDDVYLETPLQESAVKEGGDDVYLETPLQESVVKDDGDVVYNEPPLQESVVKDDGDVVYNKSPLQESVVEDDGDDVYNEPPLQESVVKDDGDDVYNEPPLQESVVKDDGDVVYNEPPLQESVVEDDGDDVYNEPPLQESVVKDDGDDVYNEPPLQESVVKDDGDVVYNEPPLQESVVNDDGDDAYNEPPQQESVDKDYEKGVVLGTPLKESEVNNTESTNSKDKLLKSCKWIGPPENADRYVLCARGECKVTPDTSYSIDGTVRVTRCHPQYQLFDGFDRDICNNGEWSSTGHRCRRSDANNGYGGIQIRNLPDGYHFLYGIVGTKPLTPATNETLFYNLWNYIRDTNLDATSRVLPITKRADGCNEDAECPDNKQCVDQTCLDLCPSACGNQTVCRMANHLPVCTCRPGYTGDPYTSCKKEEDQIDMNVYLKPAECRWITKSTYSELLYTNAWGASLLNDTCFTTENQLDPGQFTTFKRGEFPYLGIIGDQAFKVRRYGVLISEQWFLSTASCSDQQICNEKVKLGIIDNNLRRSPWMPEYLVVRREVHKDYDGEHLHDIAVYKLHMEVRFTQFIRPACLVTGYQHTATKGIFIGRLNGTLMKSTTKILPVSHCKNTTSGLEEKTLFCANSFTSANKLPLYTGFPLVGPMQKPYCMYGLLGMLTFGNRGYTRLSHYVPWIEYTILPTYWPLLPTLPPVGS